jgi:hypothetical protein
MFMLEDMENFLMFSSLAASIAALLWGGDGSLLAHARTHAPSLGAARSRDQRARGRPPSQQEAHRECNRRPAGWGGQDSLCQLLALLRGERPRRVTHAVLFSTPSVRKQIQKKNCS